jgi:hypothetical protein
MVIKPKLIPNWLIRKRAEEARLASREDDGVIGEAMEPLLSLKTDHFSFEKSRFKIKLGKVVG